MHDSPPGKGAVGTVYLARDGFSGQDVALKVIDPGFFKHPEFREVYRPQFQIEASLAEHFTYAQSMGVLAAAVLVGGAVVISLGPEAHGISFRRSAAGRGDP